MWMCDTIDGAFNDRNADVMWAGQLYKRANTCNVLLDDFLFSRFCQSARTAEYCATPVAALAIFEMAKTRDPDKLSFWKNVASGGIWRKR